MAEKIIILKNATDKNINVKSLGLLIFAGDDAVCGYQDILLLEDSIELESLINEGKIVVNNGAINLSAIEAVSYLQIGSEFTSDVYTKSETENLINNIIVNNITPIEENVGSNYYTKSEVDGAISQIEGYGIRGSVNHYDDLPTDSSVGDIWIVRSSRAIGSQPVEFIPDGRTALHMSFNPEFDGGFYDSLGHTITQYGSLSLLDGVFGKSANFDGNSWFEINSSNDLGEGLELSLGFWFYTRRTGTYGIINRWNERGWKIEVVGGKIRATISTEAASSQVSSPDLIDLNEWIHIGLVYNGFDLILLVDGQPINSTHVGGGRINSSGLNIRVGKFSDENAGEDKYLDGMIDDFFIKNSALSQDDFEHLVYNEVVGYNNEGFYQWDGEWKYLSRNTGEYGATIWHNNLLGLDSGDYQHLSIEEKSELTSGEDTELHTHDNRYYTRSQATSMFSSKIHSHDERYYTKTQVDSIVNNITFDKISSNDPNTNITSSELEILTNGSSADSLHSHKNSGGGDITGNGLDDAYDNHSQWQPGVGRTIYVDHGPVIMQASDGYAPLRLSTINYKPTKELAGGELCYYDGDMFVYDSTRGKWLCVSGNHIGGGVNSGNVRNSYLKGFNGASFTSDVGWAAHWPGTVVSFSITSDSDGCSNSVEIRKNGSPVYSLHYGNQKENHASNINIDFNAGDVLNFYMSGNDNNADRPQVWAIIKRRIP